MYQLFFHLVHINFQQQMLLKTEALYSPAWGKQWAKMAVCVTTVVCRSPVPRLPLRTDLHLHYHAGEQNGSARSAVPGAFHPAHKHSRGLAQAPAPSLLEGNRVWVRGESPGPAVKSLYHLSFNKYIQMFTVQRGGQC